MFLPIILNALAVSKRMCLVQTNLEALGYNPETFCPLLATILPLQFQVLGEVITQNLTSFCSFLVDTTFESAGEPECYRRMWVLCIMKSIKYIIYFSLILMILQCYREEVVLTDTIRQGARYSFPNIVHTSTFDNSYLTICTRNRDPFNYDLDNCTSSLAAVKEVSIDYDGNETMISYLSNLCDAFGLPVPHPNETIRARFLDQHVHHKPGGKVGQDSSHCLCSATLHFAHSHISLLTQPNIKIRHMMSDLFNYVGHYKWVTFIPVLFQNRKTLTPLFQLQARIQKQVWTWYWTSNRHPLGSRTWWVSLHWRLGLWWECK